MMQTELKYDQIQTTMTDLQLKVEKLESKLNDLEDRSRRSNIRIRNIPEIVNDPTLKKFLMDYSESLLAETGLKDFELERFHRFPRPRNIAEPSPRDVIVKFQSFYLKNKIMGILKNKPVLEHRFKDLKIFPDLSFYTRSWRKGFSQELSTLRAREVKYIWGFPKCLRIFWQEKTEKFITSDSLRKWMEEKHMFGAA
ncbi:Hypothetical predicted protein [Pelobates cultripes]|uniref:Uncharacterized protein n=1 Tax=Pelobates cultripes TaxID=61616 RepID=A0AAD1VKR4_PELCU|nr:Hypothetical predicted protein [Pelobates cultripes]